MNYIAPTAVIHPNVQIEDGVRIEDFCVIGAEQFGSSSDKPVVIGAGSHIRSHSTIYSGATLGPEVKTGHHSVIRSNALLARGVSLGSFSSIEEEARIGLFTRIHGYSQIGKGSIVGDFCWIYSLVTLMNDPLPPSFILRPVEVGDMVTVAVGSQILPGVMVGSGSFVSATSLVVEDVERATVVAGNPAQTVGKVKHLMHLETGISHPWSSHFLSYYPENTHETIQKISLSIYGK